MKQLAGFTTDSSTRPVGKWLSRRAPEAAMSYTRAFLLTREDMDEFLTAPPSLPLTKRVNAGVAVALQMPRGMRDALETACRGHRDTLEQWLKGLVEPHGPRAASPGNTTLPNPSRTMRLVPPRILHVLLL